MPTLRFNHRTTSRVFLLVGLIILAANPAFAADELGPDEAVRLVVSISLLFFLLLFSLGLGVLISWWFRSSFDAVTGKGDSATPVTTSLSSPGGNAEMRAPDLSEHTLHECVKAMQEAAIVGTEAVARMRWIVRWAVLITTINIVAAGVALAVLGVLLS